MKDRATEVKEVNGIAHSAEEEEPNAMEAELRLLDQHLNSVKVARDFRIMFLRGNRYNPEKAAKQMVAFFDSKLMLFGKDLLAKHITLNDLDEDDREGLRHGCVLPGPTLDRAGRQLLVNF